MKTLFDLMDKQVKQLDSLYKKNDMNKKNKKRKKNKKLKFNIEKPLTNECSFWGTVFDMSHNLSEGQDGI